MACDVLSVNPWGVDDAHYPSNGTVRERLAFCVNYAVLAPSIHNMQPWLFRLQDCCVEIYLDRRRMLEKIDPHGREVTISCGAALTNLQLAIQRFGNESWVQYMPEPANPDLLARVRLGRPRVPDFHGIELFRSIRNRRTVRYAFHDRPVPRELLHRLIWLASEYGCWLYFAESDPIRQRIAGLVEEAQVRQLKDADNRAERTRTIGSPAGPEANGSNSTALIEAATVMSGNGVVPGAQQPKAERPLKHDRELIESSPVLFTLGTSSDSTLDWLRAGEAIQKILLKADSEHVSASFLNYPCQVPDLREELRRITGRTGPPQLLLRMGYGDGLAPSSRRPVRDVILDETPA